MQNLVRRLGSARVLILSAAVLVAAVALAACGGGGSSSSSETAGGTTSSETGGSGAESTEKSDVNIAFFLAGSTVPTFVESKKGAEAAAAKDGATSVDASGPTNPTESASRQYAENLLQSSQPDGYAMSPCITPAFTTVWPQLESQVPNENVLSYACAGTASASEEAPKGARTLVGPDYAELDRISIETVVKSEKISPSTKGTAVLSICVAGLPSQEAGRKSARETIEKLLPDVEVQEVATSLSSSENLAKWTSALNKYSDVVLAWPYCDVDLGSLQVLKERGVGGDFIAVGNGPDQPEYLKGIINGSLSAGPVQEAWVQGYVATQLLIEGARGKKFPEGLINPGYAIITKQNAPEYLEAYESSAKAAELFQPKAEEVLSNLSANTAPLTKFFEDYPESE